MPAGLLKGGPLAGGQAAVSLGGLRYASAVGGLFALGVATLSVIRDVRSV